MREDTVASASLGADAHAYPRRMCIEGSSFVAFAIAVVFRCNDAVRSAAICPQILRTSSSVIPFSISYFAIGMYEFSVITGPEIWVGLLHGRLFIQRLTHAFLVECSHIQCLTRSPEIFRFRMPPTIPYVE